MSGTSPVGTYAETNFALMDFATYKAQIDANFAALMRPGDAFAPHSGSPANMTVIIDAGWVSQTRPDGTRSTTEVGQQSVTIGTAPSAPNTRIDLLVIDAATGVASVVAGTAANPGVAPALPAGKALVGLVNVGSGVVLIDQNAITDQRSVWGNLAPSVPWCIAGGTSDAITGTYTPANQSLYDGLLLAFRALSNNTTTTPTFIPDAIGSPLVITRSGGTALSLGDIPGAGAECLVRYNASHTRWELLNPSVSIPTIASGQVLGNASAGAAQATGTALTALWDRVFGTGRGSLVMRGATVWAALAPGAVNTMLVSGGATGADLLWSANPGNFAVRGEPVSEFVNNVGYVTQGSINATVLGGFGTVGSYLLNASGQGTWDGGALFSNGSTGTLSSMGLGGTWRAMGAGDDGYGNPVRPVLVQRIG